jgi:hypothetical protein
MIMTLAQLAFAIPGSLEVEFSGLHVPRPAWKHGRVRQDPRVT